MPQRFLKPGLITSRKWETCSWVAQSFYVRLLTLVDDFGRYDADPVLLRSHAFPLREDIRTQQVQQLCDELQANHLAVFYKADGKPYFQLTNWTERARSERSKYPTPPDDALRNPAESCGILPSPSSSSSSSSPSSPPTPHVCSPQDLPVEPPKGFPKTEADARAMAFTAGVTEEFAEHCWNKAVGRGYRDSSETLIRSFVHHAKTEWKYEQERKAKAKNAGSGQPATNGARLVIWQKELESAEKRIASILNNYAGHQSMSQDDREKLKPLRARRDELKKLLGVQV